MKKNFIMKAAMAACVATLFSSCATIISGTTATVQNHGVGSIDHLNQLRWPSNPRQS